MTRFAPLAVPTGTAGVYRDECPRFEVAPFKDFRRELVPEGKGLTGFVRADPSLGVVVQVAAAKTSRCNAYLEFVRSWRR